jgi:hypothetical protein
MATKHDESLDTALSLLARLRRELALEPDRMDALLAMFRFGLCEWCGREVDDQRHSDCDLVFNPRDPTGHGELVCHECLVAEVPAELVAEHSTGLAPALSADLWSGARSPD